MGMMRGGMLSAEDEIFFQRLYSNGFSVVRTMHKRRQNSSKRDQRIVRRTSQY
jgi:hypothetical protein